MAPVPLATGMSAVYWAMPIMGPPAISLYVPSFRPPQASNRQGDGGADGALDVLGLHHAGAGDRDDLVHHGHTGGDGPVDGAGGVDVEHRAADIGGQSAGRHLRPVMAWHSCFSPPWG